MNPNQTPDANSLLQFWLILSLTFSTLTAIGTFVVMVANRKQKREVSFSETPASKKEFDLHVLDTRENFLQVRSELKQDRHDNQVHASNRSHALYEKVEAVRQELDTKLEENRRELSEKIDNLPERVIATLKNTNAI